MTRQDIYNLILNNLIIIISGDSEGFFAEQYDGKKDYNSIKDRVREELKGEGVTYAEAKIIVDDREIKIVELNRKPKGVFFSETSIYASAN